MRFARPEGSGTLLKVTRLFRWRAAAATISLVAIVGPPLAIAATTPLR